MKIKARARAHARAGVCPSLCSWLLRAVGRFVGVICARALPFFPPFETFQQFFFFFGHKVFLWRRSAGLRERVRGGGPWEKKGRIWLIIYQCQPHNDSPCSPPIDEDNYISSEWLINKAEGKWFIIAPPKGFLGDRGGFFPLFLSFFFKAGGRRVYLCNPQRKSCEKTFPLGTYPYFAKSSPFFWFQSFFPEKQLSFKGKKNIYYAFPRENLL